MSYLSQTNATAILEGIIERAISAQPDNVTAYVIDELVALNPDVLLPEPLSDEESEEDASVRSAAAAACLRLLSWRRLTRRTRRTRAWGGTARRNASEPRDTHTETTGMNEDELVLEHP